VLKVYDEAGHYATFRSSGVLIDITRPTAGLVLHGITTDAEEPRWQASTERLFLHWHSFTDDGSGMGGYSLAIETHSTSTVRGFRRQPTADKEWGVISALSLGHNGTYHGVVKGYDNVGLWVKARSRGILVDATPPNITAFQLPSLETAGVREYTEAGGSYGGAADRNGTVEPVKLRYSSSRAFSFSWAANDQETGVVRAYLSAGSFQGGSDVISSEEATISGSGPSRTIAVSLDAAMDGVPLFWTLHTRNSVGRWSHRKLSYVVIVDTTAPTIYAIEHFIRVNVSDTLLTEERDVEEGGYQSTTAGIGCSWEAADAASNVDGLEHEGASVTEVTLLELAFNEWKHEGRGSADAAVVASTTVESPQQLHWFAQPVAHGSIYFCRVRIANRVAMVVTGLSDGVVVDTTPPNCIIADGIDDGSTVPAVDVEWQQDSGALTARWACEDPESGMRTVDAAAWDVGASAIISSGFDGGYQQVYRPTLTGFIVVMVPLVHTSSYSVKLRLTNRAALIAAEQTTGITVDITPPVCEYIHDGSGGSDMSAELNGQALATELALSYRCADAESGLASIEWRVGSQAGLDDVMTPKVIAGSDTALVATQDFGGTSTLPLLTSGWAYFSTITLRNHAGASGRYWSDGVLVDTTAPTVGTLSVKPLMPTSYTGGMTEVPGTAFAVTFNRWYDSESGLASYEYAVGGPAPSPSLTNMVDWTVLPNASLHAGTAHQFLASDLTVRAVGYNISLRATNRMGLQSASTVAHTVYLSNLSAGVVFDGEVGGGIDMDVQHSLSFVAASWRGFVDSGAEDSSELRIWWGLGEGDASEGCEPTDGTTSVIPLAPVEDHRRTGEWGEWYKFDAHHDEYEDGRHGFDGTDTLRVHPARTVGGGVSLNTSHVELFGGRSYFIKVVAANEHGHNVSACSDGFVVDRWVLTLLTDCRTDDRVGSKRRHTV
jgi:hypothetical protein